MTTNTTTAGDPTPTLVMGEPVSAIIRAFMEFETSEADDGMVHIDAKLEPDVATPFARALMRVEAELLLRDAEAWGTDGHENRTSSQRTADALVELARRCTAAARTDPSAHGTSVPDRRSWSTSAINDTAGTRTTAASAPLPE